MKACVDAQLCSGSGLCAERCPAVFELNDDGISVVKVSTVSPDLEQACRDAADGCPTGAIVIEE